MTLAAHIISNTHPVDRLGEIRAQIADIEKTEKVLVDEIKAAGPGTQEGAFFVATVAEIPGRESYDVEALVEKLRSFGVDDRFFSRHIKVSKASLRLTLKERN